MNSKLIFVNSPINYNILSYLNLLDKKKIGNLFGLGENIVFKNLIKNDIYLNIIKFQRQFKRYKIGDKCLEGNFTNKYAIRYYLVNYPTKYLFKIPEVAINKLNLSKQEKMEMENYIRNMPSIKDRTKRCMKKFMDKFMDYSRLFYVGW